MCLIYKTSQDFLDNSVHMNVLRLRNYPVEIFVNNNNNNSNNNNNIKICLCTMYKQSSH